MSHRKGTVSIDVEALINAISDDDLLAEVTTRKLILGSPNEPTDMDVINDVYEALVRGNAAEARCILNRLLFPKWHTTIQCEREYQQKRAQLC